MTDRIESHGGNFFTADLNLQALLRRSAPWLTEDDTERLSEFGAWAARDVDEQADYTNRFAPPVLETDWTRMAVPAPRSATIRSTRRFTARSTSAASWG